MEVDLNVIKRYFEGIEEKGDLNQIIEWFSNLKYEKDLVNKYRLLWDEMNGIMDAESCNSSAILGGIFYKIKQDEYTEKPKNQGVRRFLDVVSKIAAILFIPLVIWLWILNFRNSSISSEGAFSEIYSPLGTRTMFYLPDGSKGWLNGGSTLKFPVEFKGKTREVELKGEGYFDVMTNPAKPFIVKGKQISVAALGTSFNVQAYPSDPEIRITLISGNVQIWEGEKRKAAKIAGLIPGQMFTYFPETRIYRVESVNTNLVTAWKDGMLTFRNEHFSEIVKKINRWYNVDIRIRDKVLESYNYQATFKDETLDEVLKLLEYSSPIRYRDLGRERKEDGTFEKRKIELYHK